MGMNLLIAAINKYGFGEYTYGYGAGQVVCNILVRNALIDAGYTIPNFNTNDLSVGLFAKSTGAITDYAKQYFDVVAAGSLQPGDIVLLRNINNGSGHMGIFYGYNDSGQIMFYGSQSSSGPALVYSEQNVNYWNGGSVFEFVGYLRPKDIYYRPKVPESNCFQQRELRGEKCHATRA